MIRSATIAFTAVLALAATPALAGATRSTDALPKSAKAPSETGKPSQEVEREGPGKGYGHIFARGQGHLNTDKPGHATDSPG